MAIGDLRPIEQWGHDAQWDDALHHAVHALLTGEHEGYYARYGTVGDVARELRAPEGRRLVVCAQNHDQVGNRAFGDRLHGRDLRLAAFCAILSPGTPLLFAGEEYDERQPVPVLHRSRSTPRSRSSTREGRRDEFEDFPPVQRRGDPRSAGPGDVRALEARPEPPATAHHCAYYKRLLALRRDAAATRRPRSSRSTSSAALLRFRRGDVELDRELLRQRAGRGPTAQRQVWR